ncbi:M23 family metallopeptidase [Alphaproteobacteria bacterium LSUCC0719]|jgi:hypothetical protein
MIPTPFTAILAIIVLFFALPASGQQARFPDTVPGISWIAGSAIEGGMVVARVGPGVSLTLDGETVMQSDDGHALIGFHRDSDIPASLQVSHAGGESYLVTITANQRDYDIQRIDGLKQTHVTPPATVLERIGDDAAAVRKARSQSDAGVAAGDFLRGLDMPVEGQVTGIYGSQRILNGQPRQPHYGIDIAAARGTPVLAPAGGRITLVRDLYFSGWTVLMAHGLGLNSAFLHLDEVRVAEGDEVMRGAIIGTVGSTGRSTGPHLDWRLDWQGRRLDAALVRQQLASRQTQ